MHCSKESQLIATHCISCWLQQNRCSLNEPLCILTSNNRMQHSVSSSSFQELRKFLRVSFIDFIGDDRVQHLPLHHRVPHAQELASRTKTISGLYQLGVMEPDVPKLCRDHRFRVLDQDLQVHQLQ